MKYTELINRFYFNNIDENRKSVKSVVINGRTYDKYGVETATSAVALQYKVEGPSNEPSEYVTLIGVARQNPGDFVVSKEMGYEIATENAMINPVMTVKTPTPLNEYQANCYMRMYINSLPVKFVKTKQEVVAEGTVGKYNRRVNSDNYYNKYYEDYKKLFRA